MSDVISRLNEKYPGWHYNPPAGLYRSVIRTDQIPFDTVNPFPVIGTKRLLCGIKTHFNEAFVVKSIAVQASALNAVTGYLDRLSPEVCNGQITWKLQSDDADAPLVQLMGGNEGTFTGGGIGLFGEFSVRNGRLDPVIIPPSSSAVISVVRELVLVGQIPVPAGSQLSVIMTGFFLSVPGDNREPSRWRESSHKSRQHEVTEKVTSDRKAPVFAGLTRSPRSKRS